MKNREQKSRKKDRAKSVAAAMSSGSQRATSSSSCESLMSGPEKQTAGVLLKKKSHAGTLRVAAHRIFMMCLMIAELYLTHAGLFC